MKALTVDVDAALAEDVMIIVSCVVYALMGQVAAGEISGDQIMPTIERVLRRLTYDVASRPTSRREGRGGRASPRSRP